MGLALTPYHHLAVTLHERKAVVAFWTEQRQLASRIRDEYEYDCVVSRVEAQERKRQALRKQRSLFPVAWSPPDLSSLRA